jgi:hypothetical protein
MRARLTTLFDLGTLSMLHLCVISLPSLLYATPRGF